MTMRAPDKTRMEFLKLGKLRPYERNPKKHSAEQVGMIAASIREFGFLNPIIVDEENIIIAGHGRLLAAQKLGINTVPVIRASDLTDAQVQAYRLADNRLAELGEWDDALLSIELDELRDLDVGVADIGFEGWDGIDIIEDDFLAASTPDHQYTFADSFLVKLGGFMVYLDREDDDISDLIEEVEGKLTRHLGDTFDTEKGRRAAVTILLTIKENLNEILS